MILLALVGLLIFVLYWLYIYPLGTWKRMGIPYIKGYPIVGSFVKTATKKLSFGDESVEHYNAMEHHKVYGTFLFGLPLLMINDPELIKAVAIKDFDHFTDHTSFFFQDDITPTLSNNLFALKGEKWRQMRATLTSTYTASKMRVIFNLMTKCNDQMIDHFRQRVLKDSKNGKPLDIELCDVFQRISNDVIASTAFGVEVDSYTNRANDFFKMGKSIAFFATWRILLVNLFPTITKLMKFCVIPVPSSQYFADLVKGTMKEREKHNIVRPDMLNMLMNLRDGPLDGEKPTGKQHVLSDDDVTAQAFIFFLAAFETVSTTLSFAAFELASHPEVQDRLVKEIEDTLKECNGNLTYEALNKMKYLDMVFAETLRKWPPAIVTDRCATKPYTIEVEGKKIHLPVGTNVGFSQIGIQRNPKYWPKPELFDPERFSDENKVNIVPTTYIPFGVGPRTCIGQRFALMECKLGLFELFRNFELSVTEKSTIPMELSKEAQNLRLKNGYHVGMKLRQKKIN